VCSQPEHGEAYTLVHIKSKTVIDTSIDDAESVVVTNYYGAKKQQVCLIFSCCRLNVCCSSSSTSRHYSGFLSGAMTAG